MKEKGDTRRYLPRAPELAFEKIRKESKKHKRVSRISVKARQKFFN